jgi:hypothetical protein
VTAITSAEELRGGLSGLPGRTLALALTADPDASHLQVAKAVLGLEPRAEPDGSPACGWCGRSKPPGGLADESLGGPEVHACADGADCAKTRAEREPAFIGHQFPGWQADYRKYQAAQAADYRRYQAAQEYQRELAEGYRGGIYNPSFRPYYELTADEDEPSQLELAALAEVRDMVERRALEWLEPEPVVTLTAPPPVIKFDPWAHTMRNPAHRAHTLGHMRQHPRVHDAASALARAGQELEDPGRKTSGYRDHHGPGSLARVIRRHHL